MAVRMLNIIYDLCSINQSGHGRSAIYERFNGKRRNELPNGEIFPNTPGGKGLD